MINKNAFLVSVASLFFVCGCTHEQVAMAPDHFGAAVNQNIAAQIVNPDAPNVNEPPVYDGERSILAQKRYATDKVEKPTPMNTADIGGGGG